MLDGLPQEIVAAIQRRPSKVEASRFPQRLRILLDWAEDDEEKRKIAGCGWKTDTVFFINKKRLCSVMNVKPNTLNVNINTMGFIQAEPKEGDKTFWTHREFTKNATTQQISKIRQHTQVIDNNVFIPGVYATVLDDIILFGLTEKEVCNFKARVIEKWMTLTKSSFIFAMSLSKFIHTFEDKVGLCSDFYEFQDALAPRTPNVIDIHDFAVFISRFGPFENAIFKLGKFAQIVSQLHEQVMTSSIISYYFSKTYHNCFTFSDSIGEYHCYNNPLKSSSGNYLIDEDGSMYQSWQVALIDNNVIQATHFY